MTKFKNYIVMAYIFCDYLYLIQAGILWKFCSILCFARGESALNVDDIVCFHLQLIQWIYAFLNTENVKKLLQL